MCRSSASNQKILDRAILRDLAWKIDSLHVAVGTTNLRRAGMVREFIQELRGDARREAIDIYDHIGEKELKEAYLACVPRLGI